MPRQGAYMDLMADLNCTGHAGIFFRRDANAKRITGSMGKERKHLPLLSLS